MPVKYLLPTNARQGFGLVSLFTVPDQALYWIWIRILRSSECRNFVSFLTVMYIVIFHEKKLNRKRIKNCLICFVWPFLRLKCNLSNYCRSGFSNSNLGVSMRIHADPDPKLWCMYFIGTVYDFTKAFCITYIHAKCRCSLSSGLLCCKLTLFRDINITNSTTSKT
jgi:hypothetical protein